MESGYFHTSDRLQPMGLIGDETLNKLVKDLVNLTAERQIPRVAKYIRLTLGTR